MTLRFSTSFAFDGIVDDVEYELRYANRLGSLLPSLQVCLALRFYASGSFQDVCGEVLNVSQPTASRTITAVTDALRRTAANWIRFPNQAEADRQKQKFRAIAGFPQVVGCVDGTHIEIQAPSVNEHEYVNRKGRHSLNVMVMTNADLKFIGVSARWPGSVHDARVLRESTIFEAFEGPARPVRGYILGDSGYMLRNWLLTPVLKPRNNQQQDYNDRHSSTRSTVERTIGIAKRRWHCLMMTTMMTMMTSRSQRLPSHSRHIPLPMNVYVPLQERLRGTDSSMLALIIKALRFFADEPCTGGETDGDSDASLAKVCMPSVIGPPFSSSMLMLMSTCCTPPSGGGSVKWK